MTNQEEIIKHLVWNFFILREKFEAVSLFFRNPDLFRREKPISKAAINQAISQLDSIPTLNPPLNVYPIDKTGGIKLLSSDPEKDNEIIITERGTVLTAKSDIEKYKKLNKLEE